ncbi:MAG: MBL fold metallo-hydrolase [Candidatus Dormibacteraeota bacterium]|nr:MBL fold metallo-hydrolase [Candidatus Dormibacteraeota bacterium]
MTEDLLAISDRLWRGEVDVSEYHPFRFFGGAAEVATDTLFVASFANVSAIATGDGLVLVDTGSQFLAGQAQQSVRQWRQDRLHTAVFSHGHIDHVFGVDLYEAEASGNGQPPPMVVSHAAVPARFDRYRLTAGYNGVINQRQFGLPGLAWPTDYRYPDRVYRDRLSLEIGGETFELHHARGETDDHTWTWVPGRKLLCCGDFFIWASPNCGNPQKVQRYPRDWSIALREMAGVGAETLLPGHGLPIVGAERVATALTDAAALLERLHDQTVAMMNAGATLNEIVNTVRAPQDLLDRPYLHAVYDEPEFVVRNTWRLYGGWYDGNPAHLKPASDQDLGSEIARLAGGAERLAERARELSATGNHRLAGHLAQMAADAAPTDAAVAAAHRSVYQARAEGEASIMSQGVFRWAAGGGDQG